MRFKILALLLMMSVGAASAQGMPDNLKNIDLSKKLVIVTNPNGTSAIYQNRLKVGTLGVNAVTPHCEDLSCGPPPPPPRPTCHGPFCPGGMPFLSSDTLVYRNAINVDLPRSFKDIDLQRASTPNLR
jgi:hypothetical protein